MNPSRHILPNSRHRRERVIRRRSAEQGSFIIEALVSLLLFAIAIIGLVGLSVQALNQVGQSKARNDASFLAGELISDMWVSSAVDIDAWSTKVKAAIPSRKSGYQTTTNVHFEACNCDVTDTASYACTTTGAAGAASKATVSGSQSITSPLAVTICISWADLQEPTYPRRYQTSSMITRN